MVWALRLLGIVNRQKTLLILLLILTLTSAFLAASEGVIAEESPTPQLPLLMLNGAIYPQQFNSSSLPSSFRVEDYPAEATALYLLQCEGPIKGSWIEDIRRIGGEPRGYIPYNALLVGMDRAAHSRVGELGFVEWSGLYQPYFKISPALQLRLAQGGKVRVLVELFSARFLPDTLNSLTRLPVEILGAEADSWCAVIALYVPVDVLKDLAALPAVEWMELCTSGTLPGALVESAGGGGNVVKAAGSVSEKVGLGDSGLGTGGPQGIPASLNDRVLALNSLRGDDGRDPNGHGTAVAGVVAAAGEAEESGVAASCDILAYATGYGLESSPRPVSLYSLLQNVYGNGARIYLSGSVPEGKESLSAYGIYASQRDAFAWNNPSMTLVEAAGNEGTDADGDGIVDKGSLLGGATAKNVLSVGGSESPQAKSQDPVPPSYSELQNYFSGRFPSSPLRDDSSVGAPSGMAAFSSRGPARDGRIKPDLVAPATNILTTASGGAESSPGIFPTTDPEYVRAYGTSMAAASAAGNLGTMRSLLSLKLGTEPSAALLKAFALNGALDLSPGQYKGQGTEIPPAPNVVEGWGKLNTDTFTNEDSWLKVLEDKEGLRLGESRIFKIEVPSGKQLRVTLAWTDYPSLPEARLQLVNDLDLRLLDPDGNVYYPNGRNSRDPLNNAERIVLDVSGKPGDYSIEITASNVPFSPQSFALVVQAL